MEVIVNMSTKDFSSVQEKRIAECLGWEVVTGSGARNFHKGDVYSNEWLGECKTHMTLTEKIQFRKDHWDKICKEAIGCHKTPVLFTDNGSQDLKHTWCLIPKARAYDDLDMYSLFSKSIRTNIQFNHFDMLEDMKSNRISGYIIHDFGSEISDVVITTFTIFQGYFGRL